MNEMLCSLAMGFVVLALVSSCCLLARDARLGIAVGFTASMFSSLPLLAIGLSFLMIQPIIHPRSTELLKNLLLAATFLLWGAVQLMAQNSLSKMLGDFVIVLYVLDLTWTILARKNRTAKPVD
jgi:hypothetical protein